MKKKKFRYTITSTTQGESGPRWTFDCDSTYEALEALDKNCQTWGYKGIMDAVGAGFIDDLTITRDAESEGEQ